MQSHVKLLLRPLTLDDLEAYRKCTHPSNTYHQYNGPYFKQATASEHEASINTLKERLIAGDDNALQNKKLIVDAETNALIGQVNWYWKSIETNWLEVGIVIFNENYWGHGIGYKALKLWIDEILRANEKLVRIGLTTWSGNQRMMALAEKLGLKKEAVYRKARIVKGEYYDSVSYGILRDEWETLYHQQP
ncbi:GNAT family N-acetyltransferase [Fusibacter paucivorans]|uniref:GNAT family N-acetyltransferase n=1 Tax=Fusibacter paucivorans TaxID=76009 RepID=A0ABS5PQ35_9FIRM|nr:GNAT family protein [Fusibacter paucivorans]MBS7527037.1 GNAT family N-acetyltransferase [Fusibacter paucivorans]